MAIEVVRIGYTRLFEVRLLHHYWLDEGATVFDAIADAAVRTRRLLDLRRAPAAEGRAQRGDRGDDRRAAGRVPHDRARLPGGRARRRRRAAGHDLRVLRHPVGPDYANYTALSLRPQPVVDVVDPADTDVIHRYKANVPVLSNLTGRRRAPAPRSACSCRGPTSTAPRAGDGVEALVASGANLRQLTGDPPAAPFHVLGPRADLPVFVHQGDVPPIAPPAGSTGAPARGIELDSRHAARRSPRSSGSSPRRPDDNAVQLRQRRRHAAHAPGCSRSTSGTVGRPGGTARRATARSPRPRPARCR